METGSTKNDLKVRVNDKQILSIALPISFAILIPQLNLLVNNVFLGHLSENALGNAGITGVFYLIFAVAGHGLNNSIQSVFSHYAGSGQPDFFNSVLVQGIRISLQLALGFILFTWLLAPYILKNIAQPENLDTELSFLRIRILGLPFLYLFQMGNAFLVASLNSRYLFLGFVIEAGSNILLDYLLIFGHWGLPAMGFQGAAVASVIAEALGLLSVFAVIHYTGLKRKYQLLSSFVYDKVVHAKVLKVSIPLILQYIISCATWFVFFLLIETKGDMAKAVSNTMRNVFGIAGVFVWAFSGTCNSMVSNVIGQRQLYKVIPVIQRISLWSFGLCLSLVILLNIFPESFFSLFGQTAAFKSMGKEVLVMVSFGILIMSISNVWLNGLTGTGKTGVNLSIEITAITTYLIYTYFFMKHHFVSLAMAWTNELVYWSVILILSYFYLKSSHWKKGIVSR